MDIINKNNEIEQIKSILKSNNIKKNEIKGNIERIDKYINKIYKMIKFIFIVFLFLLII